MEYIHKPHHFYLFFFFLIDLLNAIQKSNLITPWTGCGASERGALNGLDPTPLAIHSSKPHCKNVFLYQVTGQISDLGIVLFFSP